MATAEQLKSLIRSHFSNDPERFYTIALQVAAHEARQGHKSVAEDIRALVERERKRTNSKIISFEPNLQGLIQEKIELTSKSTLVVSDILRARIERIIHEYRQRSKLKSFGLMHRRKILLVGAPGTGKTITAEVLASAVNLPFYTIQVDRLVTKFMGETSAKLRQIFDLIQKQHGVYFFDEFDAIGGERTLDNDVGEMRRVLNSFLQFIEQDTSDSLIIAATNNPQLLDSALFRRFDDVLKYAYPSEDERKLLIENILGTFMEKNFKWLSILKKSESLSHSEIRLACCDAIKNAILFDKEKVTEQDVLEAIEYRQQTRENI